MANPSTVLVAHRISRLVLAALGGLTLVSCSITEPGRGAQSSELARNRQKWERARLHDYEYDYHRVCFCTQASTEQVHIVVRADRVSTVTRARDGLPAITDFGTWPSVADLFADVQRQIEQKADRLDVTYDPTYGYPKTIAVDVYLQAVDDEFSQLASNLRPLPTL
jgi:uncharacterized protein DUF6174